MAAHPFDGTILSKGITDPDVTLIKQRFNDLDNGTQFSRDPHFGAQLKERVVLFQKRRHLVPDGMVGPATWMRLFDLEPQDRAFPKIVVRANVACQSSRTSPITLIVLHSTEGQNVPKSASDLSGLASFFNRLTTQASSHVGTDSDGQSARMVPDSRKAWTCAGFNSMSLNIEQIGFAAQKTWEDAELRETARWIAYWHRHHNVPIARSMSHGVCFHSDLGAAGGGHHDPGGNYPLDRVLGYAEGYVVAQGG